MELEHLLILDLFDELEESDRAELAARLASSPELRRRRERLLAVVQRYQNEPEEEPPRVSLLTVERPGVAGRGGAGPTRAGRLGIAASLLLALLSFAAGRVSQVARPEPATVAAGRLEALASEAGRLRREVAIVALRQERAAGRIAAVERLALLAVDDPALAEPLHAALRDDPSVNVRLAAIDALFAAPALAPPSDEIATILAREPTAELRLALLDWIATARPTDWMGMVAATAELDESRAVRRRAQQLLGERS